MYLPAVDFVGDNTPIKLNPESKGVILSILALVLVVGCPAAIALADADDSTILRVTDRDPQELTIDPLIQVWPSGTSVKVPATSTDTAAADDLFLFSDFSVPEAKGFTLFSTKTFLPDLVVSDAIDFDIAVSSAQVKKVTLTFFDVDGGKWNSLLSCDLTDGPYVLSATERLLIKNANNTNIRVELDAPVGSTFTVSFGYNLYTAQDLISDNTIEIILSAAGLLLIISAVYATPWIKVGSVTAAAERAYRAGVRAGKCAIKMTREASSRRRAAKSRGDKR